MRLAGLVAGRHLDIAWPRAALVLRQQITSPPNVGSTIQHAKFIRE